MSHTVFITGAAGYVGTMLARECAKRDDVGLVVALDKDPMPELLRDVPRIRWITANLADPGWESRVSTLSPTIVIHAAWQIREMYGKQKTQWQWNVEGSTRVFRLACETPSVRRLVHFSTASIYGAFPSNTLEYRYKETDSLREKTYLYGIEKREVEERLDRIFSECEKQDLETYVVRPAAISGPRGRAMTHRFGLQSVLTGKVRGSWIYGLIRRVVSRIPATTGWCRQFVHEDDVVDITLQLAFTGVPNSRYEKFNLAPPGLVLPVDMAQATGKRLLYMHPQLIRLGFFVFWHLSRGKVPTSRGGWKFYSYPIVMDGSKVERLLGYRYRTDSKGAFTTSEGRYAPALHK